MFKGITDLNINIYITLDESNVTRNHDYKSKAGVSVQTKKNTFTLIVLLTYEMTYSQKSVG